MKPYLLLFSSVFVFWVSACTRSASPVEAEENAELANRYVRKKIDRDADFLKTQFPTLSSIVPDSSAFHAILNDYAYDVMNPQKSVENENDLMFLFGQREHEIIPILHQEFLDPISVNKSERLVGKQGRDLQAELQKIGMQCVYSEGYYVTLSANELLPQELKRLGSEVLRLYMDFVNAQGNASNGEYPYLDLSGEGDMIAIGEVMMQKYPEHEYTKTIIPDFYAALNTFTDVHIIKGVVEGDVVCVVGGLATEPYPTMTVLEQHKAFLQKYPQSRYASIVEKMLANPSQINGTSDTWNDLYLVVLRWMEPSNDEDIVSCDEADMYKNREFLDKNIDVLHTIQVDKNEETTCAIVYRFYPDQSRANKALSFIRPLVRDSAVVVRASYDLDTDTWLVK